MRRAVSWWRRGRRRSRCGGLHGRSTPRPRSCTRCSGARRGWRTSPLWRALSVRAGPGSGTQGQRPLATPTFVGRGVLRERSCQPQLLPGGVLGRHPGLQSASGDPPEELENVRAPVSGGPSVHGGGRRPTGWRACTWRATFPAGREHGASPTLRCERWSAGWSVAPDVSQKREEVGKERKGCTRWSSKVVGSTELPAS